MAENQSGTESTALDAVVLRRLLLAKQFYSHGVTHYASRGHIDKMIAIHNFHNSLEILLRAILIRNEVKSKTSMMNFEELLSSAFEYKKDSNFNRLRQQLTELNRLRNFVQHNATPPHDAQMEEWRVLTLQALELGFLDFFGLEFQSLSAIDAICDTSLRKLLKNSFDLLETHRFKESLILSRTAFECASYSVLRVFFKDRRWMKRGKSEQAMLIEWIKENQYFSLMISTGVNLADYGKFVNATGDFKRYNDFVMSSEEKNFNLYIENIVEKKIEKEDVRWVHEFTVNTITHWQSIGLSPSIVWSDRKPLANLLEYIARSE